MKNTLQTFTVDSLWHWIQPALAIDWNHFNFYQIWSANSYIILDNRAIFLVSDKIKQNKKVEI